MSVPVARPPTRARARSGMAGRRAALRQLVHRVIERMRHHDLMLYAAGLTFYAAIAVVPLMLLAVAGAAAIVGEGAGRRR